MRFGRENSATEDKIAYRVLSTTFVEKGTTWNQDGVQTSEDNQRLIFTMKGVAWEMSAIFVEKDVTWIWVVLSISDKWI